MTIKEILLDREMRLYACSKSLLLFSLYYFPHYWSHKSSNFHKEFCSWLDSLDKWDLQYLVLCWFRWSSKTSFAKQDLIRNIVYGKKKMCLFVSYDEDTSRDNLFDVALELQTNKRLIADFWQLYYDTSNEKKSKKTSVWNFLTANWIRVLASSVKKTIRWKAFSWWRPDYVILDDFENNDTKVSNLKTKRVINYFDELLWWLGPWAWAIFCCNKISDTGSVAWLYDKFEWDKNAKIIEKAVIENGEITWKDRYVMTDKEQYERNKMIENKREWVFSLESLKRTMNKDGRRVFEQEMLNLPMVDWDRFFDTIKVDKLLIWLKWYSYDKDWRWKVWNYYDNTCSYIFGVDVSEWFWLDSSVICVLNRDTMEQVAEYEYSYADPEMLSNEIISAHRNYWGKWLIIIERNSIWNTIIEKMKEKWMSRYMPLERVRNDVKMTYLEKYWFQSNKVTRPKILFNFKEIFESWLVWIFSVPLLQEMRWFSILDIRYKPFDPLDDLTNHFDRVMAFAIALEWLYYRPIKDWKFKRIDPEQLWIKESSYNFVKKQ